MHGLTVLVIADPAAKFLKHLNRLPPEVRMIASNDPDRLREVAPEADVIFHADFRNPRRFIETFALATRVRWVHSMAAGVENLMAPEIVASRVPMTNGRGVFRRPLGEWVVGAMLYFSYDLRRMLDNQQQERWAPFEVEELHGKTLGIVGYGEIGHAAAERARPFGMLILALRRKPELTAGDPLIDAAYGPLQLNTMLAECDYVAVTAALTPKTRGMIGAGQFAAMKRTAVIVNVARGAIIDEPAMIGALESRQIRGAALDVFSTEPLPAGNPLYRMTNVLVSPHTADHTAGWMEHAVDCFLENFSRFERGEPLQNLVDKHAGY